MDNQGLLFIPDISGFTRFINETEIGHSRLIIQELLEILLNTNEMELEVSEIEGDAILFYRFGKPPDLKEIYHQAEKMFCEFHRHLLAYDYRRYCQCKACMSAVNLTLKIITHYGEFASYRVKNFNKLIGKDVILAHQLLKNEVEKHEYWMITKNLQQSPLPGFRDWMQWNSSIKKTEQGEILFHYTILSQLKNEITPDPVPPVDLSQMRKIFSVSKDYDTDIITLFHASGDFHNRHRWMEGVKRVEEVNHFLPRVGMKCRCILEDGEARIYSSSYSFSPDKIEFTETDDKNGSITEYILEKLNSGETGNKTRLTLNFYLKKNFFRKILFNLSAGNRREEIYRKSLLNLTEVVKEIKLPHVEI